MSETKSHIDLKKIAKVAGGAAVGAAIIGMSLKGVGCPPIDNENTGKTIQVENTQGKEQLQLIEQVKLSDLLNDPIRYAGKLIETEGYVRFMGEGTTEMGYRLFEETPENLELIKAWPETLGKKQWEIPAHQDSLYQGRWLDINIVTFRDAKEGEEPVTHGPDRVRVMDTRESRFSLGEVKVTGVVNALDQDKNYARVKLDNPSIDKFELVKDIK